MFSQLAENLERLFRELDPGAVVPEFCGAQIQLKGPEANDLGREGHEVVLRLASVKAYRDILARNPAIRSSVSCRNQLTLIDRVTESDGGLSATSAATYARTGFALTTGSTRRVMPSTWRTTTRSPAGMLIEETASHNSP